jgi:transcription elongation factor SPT4
MIEIASDLQNYTTSNYSGMVAMMDPEHSWVARWQGLISLYPGIYAIDVKSFALRLNYFF